MNIDGERINALVSGASTIGYELVELNVDAKPGQKPRITVVLEQSDIPEQLPGVCVHPEDSRIDMSTMGRKRFKCRECGEEIEETR
jgi:hypothetical protein